MKIPKPEEIKKVIVKYKDLFEYDGSKPVKFPTDQRTIVRHEQFDHCYWMLTEMEKFVDEDPIKAYGWLCNIQGFLWGRGIGVVDDYREDNRSIR